MWVSLFDSVSVLKFDRTTGELLTTINAGGSQGLSGVDPDYKPTLAETDQNNNIWTTYTNSLCSILNKYDTNGNLLTTINLPLCSNPMDTVIDFDNNVWVSLTYQAGPPYYRGNIVKIDSTTNTQVSSFDAAYPEYLTMDQDGNIWYTYNVNNIARINSTTGNTTTGTIGTYPTSAWFVSSLNDPNVPLDYNCLEGIAADSANRIWVINAYERRAYVLSATSIALSSNDYITFTDNQLSSEWSKSLQAFGDWTGLRYIQKYNIANTTNILTGDSGIFTIDSINNYDFRKFNESWDATTQIRDYALPEHLYNDYNLFINYIGTMIGGLETSANSIARKVYERAANYVSNHVDVDTCNIHQLYSLATEIDVPADNYDFNFPMELKRLMDVVSISQRKLWGGRCVCTSNFKSSYGVCDNCGHNHGSNRGNGLDTDTYVVSADVPFVAEYKFSRNRYELITPTVSGDVFTVAQPYLFSNSQDYCYFEYVPTRCDVQSEGVINWDDDYTTLNETVSSLESWYNNNEIVEKMLSYYIHKGLGF
jgi:hypothetical protein